MWDAAADGYTRGEGFSAIFLKTLSQAIADGDHIECIVRETGVNSDGKTPGTCLLNHPYSFLRRAEYKCRYHNAELRVTSTTDQGHVRQMRAQSIS